jgi:CBS-domain-containing membrane protein
VNRTKISELADTFRRRQKPQSIGHWLKSGLGGLLAIAAVHLLGDWSGQVLIMAPFGATCVLLFAVPDSPLSQPANVVGGHLVASTIGLLLAAVLPAQWWGISLAVGVAIAAMSALRVTHPPAGADPIVIFLSDTTATYLLAPVLLGSLVLVAAAMVFHRLPPHTRYPV